MCGAAAAGLRAARVQSLKKGLPSTKWVTIDVRRGEGQHRLLVCLFFAGSLGRQASVSARLRRFPEGARCVALQGAEVGCLRLGLLLFSPKHCKCLPSNTFASQSAARFRNLGMMAHLPGY